MIRYGDAPVFLEISSIINQFSMETKADGSVSWKFPPYEHSERIGAGATYYDRPTITYDPLSGEKFAQTLMKPIPTSSILNLASAGYPIDLILRLSVHSINGIQNRYGGSARRRDADLEFYTLTEKMRRVQQARAVGLKIKMVGDKLTVVFVFRKNVNSEVQSDIVDIRRMLGLNPDLTEFTVVAGSIHNDDTQIALLTRSLSEILSDLGADIQVPDAHVAEGRTSSTQSETREDGTAIAPFIEIHSSKEKPSDAFVSVSYRGYWFWIDDKDLRSKRRFSFLRAVFALTETGGAGGAPIVTIPAG
jgi:hypothetical protein